MHGAALSDLYQSCPLFLRECPIQGDLAVDAVDLALFGFTLRAVHRVDLRVMQAHRNPFQGPALASRIQRHSHGGS